MDGITVDEIVQSFEAAEAAGGSERDVADMISPKVFNLAVGKIYQNLKNELMPKFLVSDSFKQIKTGPQVFQTQEDANALRVESMEVEDSGQEAKGGDDDDDDDDANSSKSLFSDFPVLGNPFGLSAFERFLSQSSDNHVAEDLVFMDFLFEVMDFKTPGKTQPDRMRRYGLIRNRYRGCTLGREGPPLLDTNDTIVTNPAAMEEAAGSSAAVIDITPGGTGGVAELAARSAGGKSRRDSYGSDVVRFIKDVVPSSVFDGPLRNVVLYLRERHAGDFRMSWFATVTERDRRMQRTINNVQILENFSLARNLDQALAEPEPKTIQGRFFG